MKIGKLLESVIRQEETIFRIASLSYSVFIKSENLGKGTIGRAGKDLRNLHSC